MKQGETITSTHVPLLFPAPSSPAFVLFFYSAPHTHTTHTACQRVHKATVLRARRLFQTELGARSAPRPSAGHPPLLFFPSLSPAFPSLRRDAPPKAEATAGGRCAKGPRRCAAREGAEGGHGAGAGGAGQGRRRLQGRPRRSPGAQREGKRPRRLRHAVRQRTSERASEAGRREDLRRARGERGERRATRLKRAGSTVDPGLAPSVCIPQGPPKAKKTKEAQQTAAAGADASAWQDDDDEALRSVLVSRRAPPR